MDDINTSKEKELNGLRLQLKKAKELGGKWTNFTNIIMFITFVLLVLQCFLTYKSVIEPKIKVKN